MTTLTDRQRDYITALLSSRVHGLATVSTDPLTMQAEGRPEFVVDALDSNAASRFIAHLQALPKAAAPVALDKVGIYRHEGVLYRVRKSKAGRLYAESWDGEAFTYDAGAVYRLLAGERLTAAEVASLGHLTGVCWVCFRKLTDAKSIAAGIGPVCVKKYGE